MFTWLTRNIRFGQLASHWQDTTGIELETEALHQTASSLMKEHSIRPEDAWLGALVQWVYACHLPQTRLSLARGIMQFIDDNARFQFDDEALGAALTIAQQILNEA